MDTLRFTASMNTSNSSMALKGDSTFSPSASVSASVAVRALAAGHGPRVLHRVPAPAIFTSNSSEPAW